MPRKSKGKAQTSRVAGASSNSLFDAGITTPWVRPLLYTCAFCNAREKSPKEFPKCSNCRSVRYCSVEEQKKHWKTHKKDCKARANGLMSDFEGLREYCIMCHNPTDDSCFLAPCGHSIHKTCINEMAGLPRCPVCLDTRDLSIIIHNIGLMADAELISRKEREKNDLSLKQPCVLTDYIDTRRILDDERYREWFVRVLIDSVSRNPEGMLAWWDLLGDLCRNASGELTSINKKMWKEHGPGAFLCYGANGAGFARHICGQLPFHSGTDECENGYHFDWMSQDSITFIDLNSQIDRVRAAGPNNCFVVSAIFPDINTHVMEGHVAVVGIDECSSNPRGHKISFRDHLSCMLNQCVCRCSSQAGAGGVNIVRETVRKWPEL